MTSSIKHWQTASYGKTTREGLQRKCKCIRSIAAESPTASASEPARPSLIQDNEPPICDRIQEWKCRYEQTDAEVVYPTFHSYLYSLSNIRLTEDQLKMFTDTLCCTACSNCDYFSAPVFLPPMLEVENKCQLCDSIRLWWNSTCVSDDTYEGDMLRAKRLNGLFGMNLSAKDYLSFLTRCDTIVNGDGNGSSASLGCNANLGFLYLCPGVVNAPITEESCTDVLHASVTSEFSQSMDFLTDSIRNAFIRNMMQHCLNSARKDTFYYQAPNREYHHTLYYYDQAGNLVKTVPPEGVVYANATQLTATTNYRKGIDLVGYFPSHRMATKYWYTSMNQVCESLLRIPSIGYKRSILL